ncbi:MAG: hypothetical protein GY721_05125 [Deltaproteobacteria bacterium]|nr:hypothetical protein [Deltaproteobacteria bacterium]
MVSQTCGINATKGERERYGKSGRVSLHNRKIYPRQEAHQGLDRGKEQPIFFYDSRLSERLEKLRREISEMERRIKLYNKPVSTDNFL